MAGSAKGGAEEWPGKKKPSSTFFGPELNKKQPRGERRAIESSTEEGKYAGEFPTRKQTTIGGKLAKARVGLNQEKGRRKMWYIIRAPASRGHTTLGGWG